MDLEPGEKLYYVVVEPNKAPELKDLTVAKREAVMVKSQMYTKISCYRSSSLIAIIDSANVESAYYTIVLPSQATMAIAGRGGKPVMYTPSEERAKNFVAGA